MKDFRPLCDWQLQSKLMNSAHSKYHFEELDTIRGTNINFLVG
jgi:hypothetical protein